MEIETSEILNQDDFDRLVEITLSNAGIELDDSPEADSLREEIECWICAESINLPEMDELDSYEDYINRNTEDE